MGHTLGPWAVVPYVTTGPTDDPFMVYRLQSPNGDLQARYDALNPDEGGDYDQVAIAEIQEENDGNAKVLGQALNMLETLEGVRRILAYNVPSETAAIALCDAAIARAKGAL